MEIQTGKKIFIKVTEYEGTYQITQGYKDKDGKFKPEMCMRRSYEKQDYSDKRSLAVYMGKGEEGRSNLCALAMSILAMYGNKQDCKTQNSEQDIPLNDCPF